MSQLPVDCLNEIFEHLDECNEKVALRSCLLVNHLWCEVSVRILWRDDWRCITWNYSSLIACLPSKSKEILYNHGIIIPTSTSPPMFNYAAFCKVISCDGLLRRIRALLNNQPSISSKKSDNDNNDTVIVAQEILKMFMNQVSSLRKLDLVFNTTLGFRNITFTTYPGANDCLNNLSELICCTKEPYIGFFNQLSQICRNIQSIKVKFGNGISGGLIDLILSQKNLKYLCLSQRQDHYSFDQAAVITGMIPSLIKLPNTLIKLEILNICYRLPSISGFTNLYEFVLSFYDVRLPRENYFSELQIVTFPKLQILRLNSLTKCSAKFLDKFLKNNGGNLKELYAIGVNKLNKLNSAIIESCPNLKILTTYISYEDSNNLKEIFNNCQQLESFTAIYDDDEDEYLNESKLLDIVTEYSPKSFHKLTLAYRSGLGPILLPKVLNSFFKNWKNRIPQKSLSLFVKSTYLNNDFDVKEENMKIIEKYCKLGVIRKFEFINC